MNTISKHDREILRSIAARQLELANSKENELIMKKWQALAQGRRESPTVRFLVSNFTNETISPRQRCEGQQAREIEFKLLAAMAGRELFNDDTPLTGEFLVNLDTWASPFGIMGNITHAEGENAKGYHINPIICDLEEDFDKITPGSFGANVEKTNANIELAQEIFGDILTVRRSLPNLCGGMTNAIVHLMGMEQYYISMYDYPELLHKVMDMACSVYEQYYDFLENKGLLLPMSDISPISQESFAFNHELPTDNVTRTTECWGFLESQETTAVSSATFGEFVFPYQDRLARRFGLLSYGCCERVDAIWEHLSKWKNLRKLSVSPFNNEEQVGEHLRGTDIIYYSKPRAEHVTIPGPLNEDHIIDCFKSIAHAASGCLLEVAQREVGTIFGDYERGRRYVELAKQTLDTYWKP